MAASQAAIFLILWAILIKPHSVFTFSIPLNMNLLNPMLCFMWPKTVSTSVERSDRNRIPSSEVKQAYLLHAGER